MGRYLGMWLHTWVVILELCEVVDIAVDDDPQRVGLVVRRNVALAIGFGHGSGCVKDMWNNVGTTALLCLMMVEVQRAAKSGGKDGRRRKEGVSMDDICRRDGQSRPRLKAAPDAIQGRPEGSHVNCAE